MITMSLLNINNISDILMIKYLNTLLSQSWQRRGLKIVCWGWVRLVVDCSLLNLASLNKSVNAGNSINSDSYIILTRETIRFKCSYSGSIRKKSPTLQHQDETSKRGAWLQCQYLSWNKIQSLNTFRSQCLGKYKNVKQNDSLTLASLLLSFILWCFS